MGHFIMAGALFILYAYFDHWVETANVFKIFLSQLMLYTGAAIQDVTADGWILEKLSSENLRFAGPVQSLGIKMGFIIGFSGFTILEKKLDFVTLPNWFLMVAIALTLSCFLIIFCVTEKEPNRCTNNDDKIENEDSQLPTPWKIFKLLIKGLLLRFTYNLLE